MERGKASGVSGEAGLRGGLHLGGVLGCSLGDFPGRPAAVAFCQGCNMACPYCANHTLIPGGGTWTSLSELICLGKRAGGALVISGGEPTTQPGLVEVVRGLVSAGLAVKLDTNGLEPSVLRGCLDAGVSFVALDVKSTDLAVSLAAAELRGVVPWEARTTLSNPPLSPGVFAAMPRFVKDLGAYSWALQAVNVSLARLPVSPVPEAAVSQAVHLAQELGISVIRRGQ